MPENKPPKPTWPVIRQTPEKEQLLENLVDAMSASETEELQEDMAQRAKESSAAPDVQLKEDDSVYYSGSSFDNKVFRNQVDGRCDPLDYSMVATTGRIYQKVPAFPGKLEIQFCTQCPEESLTAEKSPPQGQITNGVIFEGHLRNLAACVRSLSGSWIGGVDFREPLVASGNKLVWSKDIYEQNLATLRSRISTQVAQRLLPQLWWFLDRVDKDMHPDNLGKD